MKVIVTVPATTEVLDKSDIYLGAATSYFSHARKGPQVRVDICAPGGCKVSAVKGRYVFTDEGRARKDTIEWYQPGAADKTAPLEVAVLSRLTGKTYPRSTFVTFTPGLILGGVLPRPVNPQGLPILWEGEDPASMPGAVVYFPYGHAPKAGIHTETAPWANAADPMAPGKHDESVLAALESGEGDDGSDDDGSGNGDDD